MAPKARIVDSLDLRTSGKWVGLSLLTGVSAGLAAALFMWLTNQIARVGLVRWAHWLPSDAVGEPALVGYAQDAPLAPDAVLIVVVMTVGGLISGLLVHLVSAEAEGAGTDATIFAFHFRKGKISGWIAPLKLAASAVTLGTGGSAGREGPIAQIGAALGSWFAQRLKVSPRDRRIMLAAGMAAGVGAVFRAPLAGALFAAEILYSRSDFEADAVMPAAGSSIVAYSVYCLLLPESIRYTPLFGDGLSETLQPAAVAQLPAYTLLAVLLVLVGAAHQLVFAGTRRFFRWAAIPRWFAPAFGAMLAGCVGGGLYLWLDDVRVLGVLGTGYGILQSGVTDAAAVGATLLLIVAAAKILTTALTVASGGSGGVFGPSMVVGGALGGAVGILIGRVLSMDAASVYAASPESMAVVGMAGFFAGAARAPFSTIIMTSELTGGYELLLPTMWVSTLCFLLGGRFGLYPSQVPSRLESPAHRGDFLVDVLEGLTVDEVYDRGKAVVKIPESTPLEQIVRLLTTTTQHYFPVVNDAGRMIGIFTDDDVRMYLYDKTLWNLANARDVMSHRVVSVTPQDDLNTAIRAFTSIASSELPVVSADDPGEVLGTIRQKDAVAAYNRRVLDIKREMGE